MIFDKKKNIVIYFLVFCFYLISFETITYFFYKNFSDYPSSSFLINFPNKNKAGHIENDPCHSYIIDLELYVVHDDSKECKTSYGYNELGFYKYNSTKNFNDDFNIITLGGSTTDGYLFTNTENNFPDTLYRTWPYWINEKCFILKNCKVLNGGHGGYSSTLERKKFSRHIMLQEKLPKLVISLNGINDMPDYDSVYDLIYPYYRTEQFEMLAKQKFIKLKTDNNFFPNVTRFLNTGFRTVFGIENYHLRYTSAKLIELRKDYISTMPKANFKKRSELWAHNVKYMRALAEYNNIEYLVFLQPTMGLNHEKIENMHPRDLEIRNSTWWKKNSDYAKVLNMSFQNLKEECSKLDFCIDITESLPFNRNIQLYQDARHPNGNGQKIIANRIMEELRVRKLIN